MTESPILTSETTSRTFACFAGAALVFVVDAQERILLLSHPRSEGRWEVINGAYEAGETLLDGALREPREEAGSAIRVAPLGVAHAYIHHYDDSVPMISIVYLMAYQGGEVIPGADMAGSAVGWFTAAEIDSADFLLLVPVQKWIAGRAIDLYRLWHDAPIPPLEKPPDQQGGVKYPKD
jgi:8-oxo-dGTP pyrophosphatase MutT (NUDIX family)